VSNERIAVIGLGRMGGPIADHLVAAGYEVHVYDKEAAAMDARVAAGAVAARSPTHAAEGATFVSVIVFDDAQALEVVGGTEGVLSSLLPGAIVAIHTTVSLETIHRLAAQADARGMVVLDAGISGGEAGSAAGTLLTMVGGPVHAVDTARPILGCFSKEVLHAGPVGAGMALKLARNATGYAMMVAVHEAMELAHRSGVDLALLRHTISETGVFDQSLAPFTLGGPEPLPPDADPAVRAALEHTNRLADKDLDQALHLAARVGAPVPMLTEVRRTFHHSVRV